MSEVRSGKPKTFQERQRAYAEEARERKERQEAERSQKEKQRAAPPGRRSTRKCWRIYFWQPTKDGPISIGKTSWYDNSKLIVMHGHPQRSCAHLSVIDRASSYELGQIERRFAHLRNGDGTFRASPELMDYIEGASVAWVHRPVRWTWSVPAKPRLYEPDRPKRKPKKPVVSRVCERCDQPFETKDADRFCKGCRKVVRQEMWSAGYLERMPRTPPHEAGELPCRHG